METNCKYFNGTTSQSIKVGHGTLYGIVVNSHAVGTLKLWDSASASGAVIFNTITLVAGPNFIPFPMGISFYTGLFASVTGTIDYTILSV